MGGAHFRANVVRQPAGWALLLALVVSLQAAGPATVAAHTLQARPAPGNGDSGDAAISADGRHVAFASEASSIVRGDTNGLYDVFVRDRFRGTTTERVSVGRDGAEADARTGLTDISADGRFVVLWSDASNLVAGDTNREPDVFVRDRGTGTTERVSVGSDGAQADGSSAHGVITPDGRFVAFASQASSLAPGDTDGRSAFDVFVRDRASGRTELVGDGWMPAISADGRFVAFERQGAIMLHDRAQRTTELVSVGMDGAPANGPSAVPTLSADGRFLAFVSDASNLVAGDTNGPGRRGADVFVRDLVARTTVRVSVASDGTQAEGSSSNPTISADGRVVAFTSFAPNVAGSADGRRRRARRRRREDRGRQRVGGRTASDQLHGLGPAHRGRRHGCVLLGRTGPRPG